MKPQTNSKQQNTVGHTQTAQKDNKIPRTDKKKINNDNMVDCTERVR